LGAIKIKYQFQVTLERIGIVDFFNPSGVGVYLDNTWYNTFFDVCTRRCGKVAYEFGNYANDNKIIGGSLSRAKDSSIAGYGLYFNAPSGCDTNVIIGLDIESYVGENQIACYLNQGGKYAKFYALRMEGNYAGIKINSGCNYNVFIGSTCSAIESGGYYISDSGTKNRFQYCINVDDTKYTENWGTDTISATTTKTFNHALIGTPTHVEIGWKDTGYGDWKWSATSTQITITVTTSGTYAFSWYAKI